MAKKEKKQKKEKGQRGKKGKRAEEWNGAYAGSDKARLFFARLLILLSFILLGLVIYTIHYMNYTARDTAVRPLYEAVSAAVAGAVTLPDGTVVTV